MSDDIAAIYRDSLRFAATMPLVSLLPALPEPLQHVVEFRLGMYDSLAAFRAASANDARMASGLGKVVAAHTALSRHGEPLTGDVVAVPMPAPA